MTKSAGERETEYSGFCRICGSWSTFFNNAVPIRETYQCKSCHASMRERVTAAAILAVFGRARAASLNDLSKDEYFSTLSIYEPGVSGANRKFLGKLPNYRNSFYWDDGIPGIETNGVRHEDLMNLTFADSSFDLVVTSDIFEHIRKPWTAFAEVHRVLKDGGAHIFSIPLRVPAPRRTTSRVDTSTAADIHIIEPHFHGDGRGGKSLVYTDFGSDVLDELSAIGFRTFVVSDDHTDAERRQVVALISVKL